MSLEGQKSIISAKGKREENTKRVRARCVAYFAHFFISRRNKRLLSLSDLGLTMHCPPALVHQVPHATT